MGLKSGSRDAGLDDAEDEAEEKQANGQTEVEPRTGDESHSDEGQSSTKVASESPSERRVDDTDEGTSSSRPSMAAIPYKLRRNKVNEGREQVPYFLRKEVIDAETELKESLEEMLGESVYKSDYREAAMVVAQRRPELIAEVLREWGYDLDDA